MTKINYLVILLLMFNLLGAQTFQRHYNTVIVENAKVDDEVVKNFNIKDKYILFFSYDIYKVRLVDSKFTTLTFEQVTPVQHTSNYTSTYYKMNGRNTIIQVYKHRVKIIFIKTNTTLTFINKY